MADVGRRTTLVKIAHALMMFAIPARRRDTCNQFACPKKAGHWSQVPATARYDQDSEEIDISVVRIGYPWTQDQF